MKNVRAALVFVFPVVVMLVSLSFASQAFAQSTPPNDATTQQKPDQQTESQASATASKTFTGKIAQVGGKLVLSDMDSKATYQLDDQQKAREFVNKNVKVTGVLDISTGTIRVSGIEGVTP